MASDVGDPRGNQWWEMERSDFKSGSELARPGEPCIASFRTEGKLTFFIELRWGSGKAVELLRTPRGQRVDAHDGGLDVWL